MNFYQFAKRPAREVLDLRLDRAVPTMQAVALLVALWLLSHRYFGIVHDATLYVAQGLNRLHPDAMGGDLFFAYGSQDSYSAFSSLFAPLVAMLGVPNASLVVLLVGQLAFLVAAWNVASRYDWATRWWSMSLLAVASGYYGGGGVFHFAEPFVTARTLAEPLVVAMLAGLLAGRLRLALAFLAGAFLLHPLVALPGLGVLLAWIFVTNLRRALGLAAAAIVVAALVLAFTPALDAAWKEILIYRSRHLFLTHWTAADFAHAAWAGGIVGLAMFTGAGPYRLLAATLAVAFGGVVASALVVDLAGNALAAGAQLWRALWLLQLLAVLSVVPLVRALWNAGNAARLAAVCVVASCCFGRLEQPLAAVLVLAATAALCLARRRPGWPGEGSLRLGIVAALCLGATGLLFDAQTRLPDAYAVESADGWESGAQLLGSIGLLLPLGALLWLLTHSNARLFGYAATVCALGFGVLTWDDRNAWARYVAESPTPHPFTTHVEPGAEVYWPTIGSPAWTLLRTRNWVSSDQGAGVVFSRPMALAWGQRNAASQRLRDEYAACQITLRVDCPIYAEAARAVCRLADGPSYIVLNGRVEGWRALAEHGYPGQTFRLYRCRGAA